MQKAALDLIAKAATGDVDPQDADDSALALFNAPKQEEEFEEDLLEEIPEETAATNDKSTIKTNTNEKAKQQTPKVKKP